MESWAWQLRMSRNKMARIALLVIRTAGKIGGRICWLLFCVYLATGVVSFARRWPAKVLTVIPTGDGIRVVTDGPRRGRNSFEDNWSLGLGAVAWAGLFFVRGTRRMWTGYVALGLVVGAVQGAGPYRRWRLDQQLAEVPEVKAGPGYEKLFFQRGISFIRDGFEAYYPRPTAVMFDALKGYGVDAVAVVPYGLYRQGQSEVGLSREGSEGDLYVGLMKLAHARGIRVMLKPQLWVMPGMFPGAIHLDDAEGRRVWFASYRKFILHWARIAEQGHADLFVVGTELEKLSGDEKEWRLVVSEVRKVYGGALTYAANQGPDFEKLAWWDCLDYIGLNEYYPLGDDLDFSKVIEKVEVVQKKYGKPVLLTEVGFASVAGSHKEPWSEPRRAPDWEHQRKCYEALYAAFWGKSWFYGMYPWKLSAHGDVGPEDRSLTPWRKPAMEVMGRYYRGRRNQNFSD
jgi:hypothetical protein